MVLLLWIVLFALGLNSLGVDVMINWPLQLFHWLTMGVNFMGLALAIAVVSWIVGKP